MTRARAQVGLLAICLLGAAACGDDGATQDAADTTAADSTTTSDTTSAPADAVTSDGASATDTTPDTTDPSDVADTTTPDDVTTPDAPDALDVPDVPDTSDTSDPADTSEPADTTDGAGDTASPPDLGGACPLAERLGGFQAVDDGEYGYVDGTVDDHVLPVSVLELVASEGDCRLFKRTNPFCDPPCGGGQTCDYDGACLPYPAPQDLGTVTISGLDGDPIVMHPVQPGNLYYNTELFYPPWTPGARVSLVTTGGAYAPMSAEGVAPDPLDPSATTWTLTAGQPLVVAWDAPAGAVPARVELQLLIDQHGNAPASLRCDFADDGQGTVPTAILEQLRGMGVSGFPSGKLVRQTLDRADVVAGGETIGCMDFAVRTPRNIKVVVSGHVPCTKDADCPDGKTCDEALETCIDE